MIKYTKGDILKADVEAVINTVNIVGVMGKGIALAFKKAYPENYKIYKKACENKSFNIGDLLITNTGKLIPKYIINFPTKKHWRSKSRMEYIHAGLQSLVKEVKARGIKSLAIPPLGCGNGGLKWDEVKPIILSALESLEDDMEITIYEPGFNNQIIKNKAEINLTPARAMLITALKDYQVLGYATNLLVIQKIAYFLQRFGEPLNIHFEKGYYGPYSHKLQHLIKYLNGYYLQFKHEETKPSTLVQLSKLEKVEEYNGEHLTDQQRNRLNEIQSLIKGFESPYGLELLATVDFLCLQENIIDADEIILKIGDWTRRKKQLMKPFHIKAAHQRLNEYYLTERL